jgi:hypothetical protein
MVGTVGLSDGMKKQDRDGSSERLVAPDEQMVQEVVHPMVTKKLTVRF